MKASWMLMSWIVAMTRQTSEVVPAPWRGISCLILFAQPNDYHDRAAARHCIGVDPSARDIAPHLGWSGFLPPRQMSTCCHCCWSSWPPTPEIRSPPVAQQLNGVTALRFLYSIATWQSRARQGRPCYGTLQKAGQMSHMASQQGQGWQGSDDAPGSERW